MQEVDASKAVKRHRGKKGKSITKGEKAGFRKVGAPKIQYFITTCNWHIEHSLGI